MNNLEKIEEGLKQVRDEVVACQKCSLYKTRTLPVVGQGNHQARIVFVGEAPGANEDRTGIPFCGAAGNILSELLASIGLKREDVYICNILKCRPPQNRDPIQSEVETCTSYLEQQLNIIRPEILGAMGNYAVSFLLARYELSNKIQGISKIHGQVFETKKEFPSKIIALYHPAVAVYNSNMKSVLQEDFQKFKKL